MIKISVIIPVYNKQKYIENTIKSILQQSYSNFEIILIDDGSTDNSGKICDIYSKKDSRICVYHIENSGVSNARNIGIKYATGDYIQFMDADDCMHRNIFDEYISILKNNKYDIIFTSYNKVNHKGDVLEKVFLNYYGELYKEDIIKTFVQDQIKTGYYGCVSNKLIKREIVLKNKILFDKKIVLAEDLDFYLDVYKNSSRYYYLNVISFDYLQKAENSSISVYDNLDYYQQLLIYIKMKDFIIQSGFYKADNKQLLEQKILDYIYFTVFFTKLDRNNIKNIVSKIYNNNDISNILEKKLSLSFKNLILKLIKYNKYNLVYNFLYLRNRTRTIVKKILVGGK